MSGGEVLRMALRHCVPTGAARPGLSRRVSALCRSATLGSVAVAAVLGCTEARAACTDNFDAPGLGPFPFNIFLPFGQGGAVNSLVSVINSVNTAFLTNTTAFVSAPGNPQPNQQGGGVWGRVIAGTVDTQATGVTTIPSITGVTGGVALTFPITGAQTCKSTTRQDFVGYQFGRDISILNGGGTGANWHIGATAGYFEAKSKDISDGPPDPSFSGTFQVPFAGIYTTFTKGNFFADGQVRWDSYQNQINDPLNAVNDQKFNAQGISVTANLGYRIDLPSKWFVEPSVGGVWSRVKVDPINVAGPFVDDNFGFIAAGTVKVDDVESLLGRASVRVGTSFTSGNVAYQPFATASVIREFAKDVTTTLTQFPFLQGGGPDPANQVFFNVDPATLKSSRVGTYGQFAVGSAFQILNTGWLGYGRVDYRVGENVEGYSVNAGLRYQFTPDQPISGLKDGPVPTAWRPKNWTGLYVGASGGMTEGQQKWLTHNVGPLDVDTHDKPEFAGYLAGGQIGYNLQLGRWVVGVEGDYGWSNAHGARACDDNGGAAAFLFTCEAELHRLASVAGRLGFTWNRALIYVKGGVVMGEVTVQTSDNTASPNPPSNTPVNGTTKWLTGWTLGTGAEFALTDKWSAKAEYMYYDLGSAKFPIDNGLTAEAEAHGSVARVGLNYHFGR
jgi:opacity protein-like surface antigen